MTMIPEDYKYALKAAKAYEAYCLMSSVDFDDLHAVALEAAFKASKGYDPSKSTRMGYMIFKCKTAIVKYMKAYGRTVREPVWSKTPYSSSVSLDVTVGGVVPVDQLCARETSFVFEEEDECSKKFQSVSGALTKRELEVIQARMAGKTLCEIGKATGVSRQRIDQICKRAILKCRKRSEINAK